MRSFIQYKAGTTFYQESKVSLVSRKNYIEYVFALDDGVYGVVNLKIILNQLIFMVKCGSFFDMLPTLIPQILRSGDNLPNLSALIKGNNDDYFIGSLRSGASGKEDSMYLIHRKPYTQQGEYPISTAARPETIHAAFLLLKFAQKIFLEIKNSKDPSIKNLTQLFYN